MMKKITLLCFLFLTVSLSFGQSDWKKTNTKGTLNGIQIGELEKGNFEVFTFNEESFKKKIANAPKRGSDLSRNSNVIIELPNENGNVEKFKIFESSIFAPSLAAKYPNIKSYVGVSLTNPGTTLRMSTSPKGIQTMVSSTNKNTVFMQPVEGDKGKYIVYNRKSRGNTKEEKFICSTIDEFKKDDSQNTNSFSRDANDQILRKFRIAISVNGEYTTYHGGTVEGALAAINATMTRVNAVFETDMAVTFELQDFPQLIYTNAATDPYSASLSAWNVELQNTLTNTIGNAAYDIGHMFGATGGGGNAGCIGCVCRDDTASTTDENKGAGITSPADGKPEGDKFDIDYVAHEIGHQMGANHTFSHSTEGTGVNAEPGSGSTIMGYAGITGSDVQPDSDPYFHYHSIKQITDNITNTRTCWQNNNPVTLTNNPPVAEAGSNYTIPQGTAYVLRGSATDADGGDNLMYCWEQTDSGQVTISNFGPTRTVGAMARSLAPVASPNRYIPKLSRVVAGQLTETNPTDGGGSDWETVSTISRDLNWALTVRDRQPTAMGLGGQTSFDTMKITVDATAGPFAVTSQTTNVTWNVGSSQTVTWDVAGTDSGNVNTPTVNILLSTDGGATFPVTLASNIANDGSETFTVPVTGQGDSDKVRIIVEGNNNIFYAMNSTNFTLQESEFVINLPNATASACKPDDVTFNATYNTFLGFTDSTDFSVTGLPAGASATINPSSATADATALTITITGTGSLAEGNYPIQIVGTSGAKTANVDASFNIHSNTFGAITLAEPSDAATDVILSPVLSWQADANAASYDVEVATDSGFSSIIASENVTTNSYTLGSSLNQTTQYFWRVKAKNNCGEGTFSSAFSFTTKSCTVCTSKGDVAYATSTTLVKFNTIDNASGKANADGGYSDYKSISTNVKRGETHDLTVNTNTDGNYQVQTKVWIDWNQNCRFDDAGEEYDLGKTDNEDNAATEHSPLTITVPAGASIGTTVMRVSTRWTSRTTVVFPTACQDGFDGEVEDYTIVVDNTNSTEDFSFGNFGLYPNPSNGEFDLTFKVVNTDKVFVKLLDLRGRIVGERRFSNVSSVFTERIKFDNVKTGLYLLQVSNGNKQTTKKVMIK